MVYGSVRFQSECQKYIFHGSVAPLRLESIVLPVRQVADGGRRMVQREYPSAVLLTDRGRSVPRVLIDAGIFLQCQARLRVGGALGVLVLHEFGRLRKVF